MFIAVLVYPESRAGIALMTFGNSVDATLQASFKMYFPIFWIFFFSKLEKNNCFSPIFLPIHNLSVKQFGSQMRPHVLWGLIRTQVVCKVINGHNTSGVKS